MSRIGMTSEEARTAVLAALRAQAARDPAALRTAGELTHDLAMSGVTLGRSTVKRILHEFAEGGIAYRDYGPCVRNGYQVPNAAHYRLVTDADRVERDPWARIPDEDEIPF